MRLLAASLAGCGRLAFDDVGIAGDGATPAAHIVIQRAPGGWGPLDLTAAGTIDWVHYGLVDVTSVDRKAGVSPQIGMLVHVGGGTLQGHEKGDPALDASWSDGTPTAIAGPTSTVLLLDSPNLQGDGFRVSVAAAPVQRRFRLFTGIWCARLRVEATLDDQMAVDASWDFPLSAYDLSSYTVTFSGPSSSVMDVRLIIDFNYCTSGDLGELWLGNVTLSE